MLALCKANMNGERGEILCNYLLLVSAAVAGGGGKEMLSGKEREKNCREEATGPQLMNGSEKRTCCLEKGGKENAERKQLGPR